MKLEYVEIEENICELLAAYPSGIISPNDTLSLKSLRARKNNILIHELLTWQLKSRIQWDVLGDANTKFFHSISSTRRTSNTIWALHNDSLIWVDSDDHLKLLGVKNFNGIFKDDNQTNIVDQLKVVKLFPAYLSSEEANCFALEVTLGEVEGALKSFKKDKSPGPDG